MEAEASNVSEAYLLNFSADSCISVHSLLFKSVIHGKSLLALVEYHLKKAVQKGILFFIKALANGYDVCYSKA